MSIVLFEDQEVDQLYPISLGRPAYAIRCGGIRLIDWVSALQQPTQSIVRPHLQKLQEEDFSWLVPSLNSSKPLLLINSRAVPSVAVYQKLVNILNESQPGIIYQGTSVVAAYLDSGAILPEAGLTSDSIENYFDQLKLKALPLLDVEIPLFDFPHDVVRYNEQILSENLEFRLAGDSYQEICEGVFAAEGANLGQYVVSDTSRGPIVLESDVTIGPYSILRGPIHIGPRSMILEHSAINHSVSLGQETKVGGEIDSSIIESYTNKKHHGFLGHSYIGSWVNLGAGTCNSNLKNTYGKVNIDYPCRRVETEMQFMGTIVGDYTKTAINTGIFTGKIIGVCSMAYGYVTTNVPSFVNYARLFGQVTEVPAEVMITTQQRTFARRKLEQRPCDIQLIQDLYALTLHERLRIENERLSL